MSDTVIETYADADALVAAAGDRLVDRHRRGDRRSAASPTSC